MARYSSLLTLALAALASAAITPKEIGVEAHRGGAGYRSENTLQAFAYAMEIGAKSIELDVLFSKDGAAVVWHDYEISAKKCKDTAKSGTNFPYVGKLVSNLTLAELKTLDCGSILPKGSDEIVLYPQSTIPTLEEVLDLIDCYGDDALEIKLETKSDPAQQNIILPLSYYVDGLVPLLEKRGYADRTIVQSFDWNHLVAIKAKFPKIRIGALVQPITLSEKYFGLTGYPWLGGVDLEAEFGGDWVKAAKSIGADVLSPVYGRLAVGDVGYELFTTKEIVVKAHSLGMTVFPWTVDDEATIKVLLEMGADGIITDYPKKVMKVAREMGFRSGKSLVARNECCLVDAYV